MKMLKKKYLNIITLLALSLAWHQGDSIAQPARPDYMRLLKAPKQYSILSTSEKIEVDGKSNEKDWSRAPWTDDFSDIATGAGGDENKRARCKMLWDDEFLYVYAEFKEQDIWATITQHDMPVFQDNALELFINPDGSTFNYFEFQINANETVWDLFMPRPYRSGGRGLSSWDILGLKKAVAINGTLNNPADRDIGWNIELAIPFSSLGVWRNTIKAGTIWRMNFSRVQWQLEVSNGTYTRKKDKDSGKLLPERYTVWSPQGIVNLHYPERYGYVMFADSISSKGFLSESTENLKQTLWKYYYLQQQYRRDNGKYANTMDQLDAMAPELTAIKSANADIRMFVNEKQFWIQGKSASSNEYISLDHEGELRMRVGGE